MKSEGLILACVNDFLEEQEVEEYGNELKRVYSLISRFTTSLSLPLLCVRLSASKFSRAVKDRGQAKTEGVTPAFLSHRVRVIVNKSKAKPLWES